MKQGGGREHGCQIICKCALHTYAHGPYPVGAPLTLCRDLGQTTVGVGVAHRALGW